MNYRRRTIPSWTPAALEPHEHSPMIGPTLGHRLRLMVYGAHDRRDTKTTWAEARARYARKEQS